MLSPFFSRVAVCLVLSVAPNVLLAQTELQPLPSDADRQAAREQINEVFDIKEARSIAQRAEMSATMLQTARETMNNPAVRFELMFQARKLAADAGDLTQAMKIIDNIDAEFEFESMELRILTLGSAMVAAVPYSQKQKTVEIGASLVRDLIQQDDYASAQRVAPPLIELARRARFAELEQELSSLNTQAEQLEKIQRELQPQLDKLQASPDDPAANLAVGKFLLFHKGDWGGAFLCLEKSNDELLAQLAKDELRRPTESVKQMQLAEAWWTLADDQPDASVKQRLQRRALAWYQKLLPVVKGLDKVQVERRVEELTSSGITPADLSQLPEVKADPSPGTSPDPSTAPVASQHFPKDGKLIGLEMENYAFIDTPLTLDGRTPFSIEVSLIPRSRDGDQTIVGNNQNAGVCLNIIEERFCFNFHDGSGYKKVASTDLVPVGELCHVLAVYDGKKIALFVNGEKCGEAEVGPHKACPFKFKVGADPGSSDARRHHFLTGFVNAVHITKSAIATDKPDLSQNFQVTKDTLLYYDFDKGKTETAVDASGNKQDGIIRGGGTRKTVNVPSR